MSQSARLGRVAAFLTGAGLLACSKPATESFAKRSERLVVTDGLVAAYDFDENSGATAPDISGNGNTGTLSGATWNASGRRGSALSFDGVDDRVVVPDSSSLDLTTGMTLMAWVKPASGDSDFRTVVLKEREEGLAYGPIRPIRTARRTPGCSPTRIEAWTASLTRSEAIAGRTSPPRMTALSSSTT